MSKDLEFALELAQSADEISLSRFRALDLKVETKPDRTPVTDADKAVEERLRSMISDYSPTDVVIGEEFGSAAGSREWIIDPIDGTANFLRNTSTAVSAAWKFLRWQASRTPTCHSIQSRSGTRLAKPSGSPSFRAGSGKTGHLATF